LEGGKQLSPLEKRVIYSPVQSQSSLTPKKKEDIGGLRSSGKRILDQRRGETSVQKRKTTERRTNPGEAEQEGKKRGSGDASRRKKTLYLSPLPESFCLSARNTQVMDRRTGGGRGEAYEQRGPLRPCFLLEEGGCYSHSSEGGKRGKG